MACITFIGPIPVVGGKVMVVELVTTLRFNGDGLTDIAGYGVTVLAVTFYEPTSPVVGGKVMVVELVTTSQEILMVRLTDIADMGVTVIACITYKLTSPVVGGKVMVELVTTSQEFQW